MTELHGWVFASWILCYLTISKSSDVIVQSFEGESVILPCKYDSSYHGKCHICWMIGDIPNMGCGDEIIGSDGDRVVRKTSHRYQMAGEIQHGDVSLTILNIQKTDSGKYGCRVHVPGWFNDKMYYVHLIVNDALIPTTWETTSMSSSTSERETTGVFSTAMTEVERNTTQESSSSAFSTNPPESTTSGQWFSNTTYEPRTRTPLPSTVTPAAAWACTTERWLWKTSIKYNLKMNMNSGINSHLLLTFKLIGVDFFLLYFHCVYNNVSAIALD
ncbi:hepatitis A virus cellular receptor 1 isoform X2 [Puntigrus tetrazona]|uniref:hepatitis A virus cellular receptor 1 isoform X2 n=1 Tax=Puntigrus tetrazona TaxID=1606681 RepID=UPI001C8A8CD8|nr:hepatitis A virus cellular receptor 1 isoform X2 [Puntigrus tetrazona]